MAGDNEVADKNNVEAKVGESSAKDAAESARNELLNDAFADLKQNQSSGTDINRGGKGSDDVADSIGKNAASSAGKDAGSNAGKSADGAANGLQDLDGRALDGKHPDKRIGGLNEPDDISRLLEPPANDGPKSDNEHWYLRGVGAGGEGDHDLPTGDRLERDKEGNETLTTPDGSTLKVNADGTYELNGNVDSVEEDKDGGRTVTFADGSKVKFGPGGIQQISRGKDLVKFITPGANLKDPDGDPLRKPFKFNPMWNSPRG